MNKICVSTHLEKFIFESSNVASLRHLQYDTHKLHNITRPRRQLEWNEQWFLPVLWNSAESITESQELEGTSADDLVQTIDLLAILAILCLIKIFCSFFQEAAQQYDKEHHSQCLGAISLEEYLVNLNASNSQLTFGTRSMITVFFHPSAKFQSS